MELFLHPSPEWVSDHIRTNGNWEPFITETLIEIFKLYPDHLFVDVGANLGWYTVLAAKYGMSVVAFEPVQANLVLLYQNIEVNNVSRKVRVIKEGLGCKQEERMFNVYKTNMGSCGDIKWADISEIVKVNINTFDSHFNHFNHFKDTTHTQKLIVKIDVEGTELQVLKGMKDTMNMVECLSVEVSRANLAQALGLMKAYSFKYVVQLLDGIRKIDNTTCRLTQASV